MKLLIVVDKLLTGFDAPSCTYLYIDKSMKDHGLFQAICRTNRLDGEDKEFGYIVDYMDLFKNLVNDIGTGALQVYTSELDHELCKGDPDIAMKDRLNTGKEITRFKGRVNHFVKLRDVIRNAAGETIDLKAYEADMRHLIDSYIEADEARKISEFDDMGVLEVITRSGMDKGIGQLSSQLGGNQTAIAETIENNVVNTA